MSCGAVTPHFRESPLRALRKTKKLLPGSVCVCAPDTAGMLLEAVGIVNHTPPNYGEPEKRTLLQVACVFGGLIAWEQRQ